MFFVLRFYLECPAESLNWLFLAFCFFVILIMLIFLVIQGRTPKNKESVSSKILLNHIQMLALLSGIIKFMNLMIHLNSGWSCVD